MRKWFLAGLIGTLLSTGCQKYWTPAEPMRPEWCEYKGKPMKGGIWYSKADHDTLTANIERLTKFCAELQKKVRK